MLQEIALTKNSTSQSKVNILIAKWLAYADPIENIESNADPIEA